MMIFNAILPIALSFTIMVSYVSPRVDAVGASFEITNSSHGRRAVLDKPYYVEYTEKEIDLGYRVQINCVDESSNAVKYVITTKHGYLDNQYSKKQAEKLISEPVDYTLGFQHVVDEWSVSFYNGVGECIETINMVTFDTGYGEYLFL